MLLLVGWKSVTTGGLVVCITDGLVADYFWWVGKLLLLVVGSMLLLMSW